MKKQPCLIHIYPHWPIYLVMPLGALITLVGILWSGGSSVMYVCLLLFLIGTYLESQSLSVCQDGLVLRILWIPVRRIPWAEMDGVILHPAHTGRKGRYVPPMVLVILKPGTIAQYADAKNTDPYSRPDCKTVSARFSENQEYQIREVLEQQGCTVVDYEDVIYHDL